MFNTLIFLPLLALLLYMQLTQAQTNLPSARPLRQQRIDFTLACRRKQTNQKLSHNNWGDFLSAPPIIQHIHGATHRTPTESVQETPSWISDASVKCYSPTMLTFSDYRNQDF